MSISDAKKLSVLAPAKINLYLHVTGKRDDGFHELDSLIAFANIGDQITIKEAPEFSFDVDGPYARAFTAPELDQTAQSKNLVVKAAWQLAELLERDPGVSIRLTKNMPLAAGIGGGSADAAATIWALLELWDVNAGSIPGFDRVLLSLGADVPACMACEPVRIGGIGEDVTPVDGLDEMSAVLVNPGKHCPTADVFARYDGVFSEHMPEIDSDVISFLKVQRNDLRSAATQIIPEISDAIDTLDDQEGCLLSRMSGSGATCFGLFTHEIEALDAAEHILREKPDWWVRATTLNRVGRY